MVFLRLVRIGGVDGALVGWTLAVGLRPPRIDELAGGKAMEGIPRH